MRWSDQQVLDDGIGAAPALPGLRGLLRSVRSPEFAGTVFHEVEARSVLNRVPDTSSVPFRWTVNPYRGCSHACTYCLVGSTPVLLADGRTRPIAQLRLGDTIMGTEVVDGRRRYVRTTVLAHWSTVKPAYRVRLADGSRLVTSGEHRFLTTHGWRHVTRGWCASGRRPWLRPGSTLLGPGRVPTSPHAPARENAYRKGYLCGLVRADRCFPSARLELEALGRAHHFLADGSPRRSPLLSAVGVGPPLPASSGRDAGAPAWPLHPDDDWCAGFLAGVVDTCGAVTDGVLRVAHDDEQIVGRVVGALHRLGFGFILERDGSRSRVMLHGGAGGFLRFLHRTDPATSRHRDLTGATVTGDGSRRVESVHALGVELPMYDITTGTGDFVAGGVVNHNCLARRKVHTCERASTPGSASTRPAREPASSGRATTADV